MSRKEVRLSPLLWHRKSCPRLSGSTVFMLIIRDRNDTFGLGALGGALGFLVGALRALLASSRVLLVALRWLLGLSRLLLLFSCHDFAFQATSSVEKTPKPIVFPLSSVTEGTNTLEGADIVSAGNRQPFNPSSIHVQLLLIHQGVGMEHQASQFLWTKQRRQCFVKCCLLVCSTMFPLNSLARS